MAKDSFTCYAVDLPGFGDSKWDRRTNLRVTAMPDHLRGFADRLGLRSYSLLAQDAGATVARLLALAEPARVETLVLLNTEMPGHRPPWIPFYGRLLNLPGAREFLALLLGFPAFVRSSAGFGGCYFDLSLLNEDFAACFLDPLAASAVRREGAGALSQGIRLECRRRPRRSSRRDRRPGPPRLGRRRPHVPH